jgi:hypothetical protein
MNPRYGYLIEPLGSEYNNTKNIAGVDLVVNTTIEDAAFVNRIGVVVATPENCDQIKEGDIVVVHHNVFRTYLDMKGEQRKSNEYFRDGLYLVSPERIFLYKTNEGDWKTTNEYCFVRPVDYIQDGEFLRAQEKEEHLGLLVYSNQKLFDLGLIEGDTVAFTKNSEYEFTIEGDKLYRMQTRDICLTLSE